MNDIYEKLKIEERKRKSDELQFQRFDGSISDEESSSEHDSL